MRRHAVLKGLERWPHEILPFLKILIESVNHGDGRYDDHDSRKKQIIGMLKEQGGWCEGGGCLLQARYLDGHLLHVQARLGGMDVSDAIA